MSILATCILKITPAGDVVYKAEHGEWKKFTGWSSTTLFDPRPH